MLQSVSSQGGGIRLAIRDPQTRQGSLQLVCAVLLLASVLLLFFCVTCVVDSFFLHVDDFSRRQHTVLANFFFPLGVDDFFFRAAGGKVVCSFM